MRRLIPVALLTLMPVAAAAQVPAAPATPPPAGHRLWIVAGGSATTILGDCTDCVTGHYLHTGGVLGIAGTSITPKADFGAEVFWVPAKSLSNEPIRTTYLMGTFQLRPWRSSGFFLRFSLGTAFVRNWIVDARSGPDSFTSTAFALALGAGWEWRLTPRFGVQAFGAQHVAALGDLTTGTARVENVIGNFWSVGGAVVIR